MFCQVYKNIDFIFSVFYNYVVINIQNVGKPTYAQGTPGHLQETNQTRLKGILILLKKTF